MNKKETKTKGMKMNQFQTRVAASVAAAKSKTVPVRVSQEVSAKACAKATAKARFLEHKKNGHGEYKRLKDR
jgi:hypothetical protein